MPGRLGCSSDIEIFITEKCSENPNRGKRVCALTNVGTVHFTRLLDAISEAEVTIPVGVGAGGRVNPCCGCMSLIEPWCHELNIARDGVPVWQGPVTQVQYGYNTVIVRGLDLLGWLTKRVPIGVLSNADNPIELTDLAMDTLEGAFAEDDPCALRYVYQADVATGNRPSYIGPIAVGSDNFPAFEGTYFDWLVKLSDFGLDFTVVGRRIILGVDSDHLPIAGVISDEHILGEIFVTKDGLLATNRVYSRYTGDDDADQCKANALAGKTPFNTVPCPVLVEGPKYCYGPLETTVTDAASSDLTFGIDTARQFGQILVDTASIVPRLVEFPPGSRLSPDTPFDLNELIPGMRVRAAIGGLCLEVNQIFKLLEVEYNLDANGNEEIGVTLGPTTPPTQI